MYAIRSYYGPAVETAVKRNNTGLGSATRLGSGIFPGKFQGCLISLATRITEENLIREGILYQPLGKLQLGQRMVKIADMA